jgi:hypothetical protein
VNLKLINESDEEKIVNNVYLYPHTFIRFTPSLNKNIEAADILKLTQWFPIDYFEEKILEKNAINEDFISKVI